MEAVNPCNEKEECFPSQGNVTHGQAVVRSPAHQAPPRPALPTALSLGWALPGPATCVVRPSHHPGSTLGSSTSDTAPSSPACAGLLLLCRGFLRLLEVLSWGQGEKRGRGGPEGWSWTLFLAPSSSPSRSNQNYWKHLRPWQGLRNKNQACSDKELHTESKFFFKGFRELSNKI